MVLGAGKNLLKNKEMVFGNGVKNIQAAAYNGASTVWNLKKIAFLREGWDHEAVEGK